MINLKEHGIEYDEKLDHSITTNDLVAIGNIDRLILDTYVLEDSGSKLLIKGKYENINHKYCVVGGEIIKINSYNIQAENTLISVSRELEGTTKKNWTGFNIRTVILLNDTTEDVDTLDFSYEDTIGSVMTNLFPCELGSGSLSLKSDPKLWSANSLAQKYRCRPKKTMVYIFKGLDNKRFLKFTTVVTKISLNSRGMKEPNKIKLDIRPVLSKWYDKDLAINQQLKGTNPKEFFKMMFSLRDEQVYYAQGVTEKSFLKISNMHTKEYTKYSDLLRAYCSNGVRFCFDRFERVKIFSDFFVDNIQSMKTIEEDITDITLSSDENLIYNTINTKIVQRQTMYNFEDMQNKYVLYSKKLSSIINSNKFISKVEKSNSYVINGLTINNLELHQHVQIGDLVCFKRTKAPHYEYYAKVIDKKDSGIVEIMPIRYDKDYKLFDRGKGSYLFSILYNDPCMMDLYFVRNELPMVFKYTRNRNGEEKDASLMFPLLPRVNGESKYKEEVNITFGCASNLKVGSYTGIVEEIDSIYGTFDNTKLLYNMELKQFGNEGLPPVFVLSNKMTERLTDKGVALEEYTSFDNSNLLLEIQRPKDNKSDATVIFSNTTVINSDIDLMTDKEIGRIGNQILEVKVLQDYHMGDVLIVNKPDDLTSQEELEYDEILSTIKWRVVGKEVQKTEEGEKYYILVDSPFAKRQQRDKVYSFTKFPNWSIVYLQEMYIRGNPVIEFTQDVVGTGTGVNYDGDRSTDIYGEKKYEFDSKQLDKQSTKMMMGYILDHFDATTYDRTKFNVPVSIFNGIDIELLDVITLIDTTMTNIESTSKWLVVSCTNNAKTNQVKLKLLNINTTNTEPFKINVKDVLEYKPVEIPTYDHNGSEGTGGENDGNGGDGEDPTLGRFSLAEINPKLFRAKVDKFEGGYIYFKDFAGEEWETYSSKLFPVSEFGVSINGETMLVQSDQNYRAFIRKRDVYNTKNLTIIEPENEVKFLITTSFTDVDGTFMSRKCLIGDGDTYFAFNPITGAKFVGDFVVGEGNHTSSNDLWQSLQKNRTFRQDDTPVSDVNYTLKEGDIWYDTNDENHIYRYNGDVWLSCRDGSIISTRSSTFVQPNEPQATEGRPIVDGSTWYDSDDGNKPYVYKNGKWVNVTDMTLTEAIAEAQKQADNAIKLLDDIASDNKLTPSEKQTTKKDWDIIVGEYPKIVDESKKFGVDYLTYKQSYEALDSYLIPLLTNLDTTSAIVGSTFRANFKNYYDNRQVVLNRITTKSKELADNAQRDATTALGNSKIFYQTTPPTQGMKKNDLWYDTDDKNHPYIYNGSSWVSARDKIYETEGGNKVYFQDNAPPTSGVGVKAGDMWFDTNDNNKMYVLQKSGSTLTWRLADDSLDKINTGRIVLNGNTTINGDFRVRGRNIELTGDTAVTGTLSVFGGSTGIISYNGSSESNSTKRIIIQGGQILFQEKI